MTGLSGKCFEKTTESLSFDAHNKLKFVNFRTH